MGALLNTLVKLASLGASGICIFAIFWIGWLILRPPENHDPERHRTLRAFMATCVVIAIISAASGIANAINNAGKISQIEKKNSTLESEISTLESEILALDRQQLQTKEAAKGLETVLRSKEGIDVDNQSDAIKRHIRLLKEFLDNMGINEEDEPNE